jgi:WD40 repeat protein
VTTLVVQVATGARTVLRDVERVETVAFSPDGTRVLGCEGRRASTWDLVAGPSALWDAATGAKLADLGGEDGFGVWSPGGARFATFGASGACRVFDSKGALQKELSGHRDVVLAAAFDAAGNRLITVSKDGTAKVWDVERGVEWMTFSAPGAEVRIAGFSPDGASVFLVDTTGLAKLLPIDPLAFARKLALRELTKQERELYGLEARSWWGW